MKTISVKLPEALAAQLVALAHKRHSTKTDVVREALEAYLNKCNGAEGISCYDRAPHLAGCLESGVGDLSYNKKHMEGFGK